LQRKFLALITETGGNGEVSKTQVAFLTDRIRFNEINPQVYGTVIDWDEKGELSCEVEDPANLDSSRWEMGLPATQENDLEAKRCVAVRRRPHLPPAHLTPTLSHHQRDGYPSVFALDLSTLD
jgi:hypothetical protein